METVIGKSHESDEESEGRFSDGSTMSVNPLRRDRRVGPSNDNVINLVHQNTEPWMGLVGTLEMDDVTRMFEKITPTDLNIMLSKRGPDGYVTIDVILQLVRLKGGFIAPDEVASVIHHNINEYNEWHDAYVKGESAKTNKLFETRQTQQPNRFTVENRVKRKTGGKKCEKVPPTPKKCRITEKGETSPKGAVLSSSFQQKKPSTQRSRTLKPPMKYEKKQREVMFGLELVKKNGDTIKGVNDHYVKKIMKQPAFTHDVDFISQKAGAKNKYPGCLGCAYSFLCNEWNVMRPDTSVSEVTIVNTHLPRDGQSCFSHPTGCGKHLTINDLVCTMGEDTHLVKGKIYHIGVYRVVSNKVTGCKIGIVKAPYHQLQYFTNRIGVITHIHDGDDQTAQRGLDNGGGGWATMSCVDIDYKFKL